MSNLTHFMMELKAFVRRGGMSLLVLIASVLILIANLVTLWHIEQVNAHLTNRGQEKHLELWVEPDVEEIPVYIHEAQKEIPI